MSSLLAPTLHHVLCSLIYCTSFALRLFRLRLFWSFSFRAPVTAAQVWWAGRPAAQERSAAEQQVRWGAQRAAVQVRSHPGAAAALGLGGGRELRESGLASGSRQGKSEGRDVPEPKT
jgi:hypothetical protein